MAARTMIGWIPGRALLASIAGVVLVWHPVAQATVYSWRGADGVLMLSNDLSDVPQDQQATVQKFTAKPAPVRNDPPPQPQSAEAPQLDAYRRGFDAGLQAAERRFALAAERARAAPAPVPESPPVNIIIEQSAPPVAPYASAAYAPPFYGLPGPYAPFPFLSGFAVNVVPHRRFFPGAGGRRFAPFFSHGRFPRGQFPHGRFPHCQFPRGQFSHARIGRMR